MDPSRHPLLQKPIHVFNIPEPIVSSLSIRTSPLAPPPPRTPSPALPSQQQQASTSLACNVCQGVTFSDVQEQRAHFKSDWHRYNVKTRLTGKGATITEDEFGGLVDGLSDSLSGSASDDDSDESSDTALSALLRKQTTSRPSSPSSELRTAKSALVWFQSEAVPVTQLGVYSALFPPALSPSDYVSTLQDMQRGGEDGKTWTLFMTAGGHFAGMVVRVQRSDAEEEEMDALAKAKGNKFRGKPDVEILRHKTFHRYTTRRKQGGSQSLNDQAKGNAKSAGAQLRRYGEQALRDDIRNLLVEWQEDIDASERIFVRASAANKRIFWGYDDNVIEKGDRRIRSFPFPTRRPTQAELSRCLTELTRVKVSHLTEDALRAMDEAYLASLPKPKVVPVPAPAPPPKVVVPKLTKEEEIERDRWRRVIEMTRKGRLEPLKAFWEREAEGMGGVNVAVPEWAEDARGLATLLQIACSAGQEEVTRWLLEDQRADPTVPVPALASSSVPTPQEEDSDEEGRPTSVAINRRTAYDLAPSRSVRNVFRRCAYSHPEWWDWSGAARVPSVLSPEMEEDREKKKGVRRKGLRERMKEREKEREEERLKAEEEERALKERERLEEERRKKEQPTAVKTGPQRLGGAAAGAGRGAGDGMAGLTPEMRARIERERRARAAEARLRGT